PRHLLSAPHYGQAPQHLPWLIAAVEDLARCDRGGDTLELEVAQLAEGEHLPPGKQVRDRGAAEDLPTLRAVTQPPRDHHRRPEVIGLLAQRLTHVEPHADC